LVLIIEKIVGKEGRQENAETPLAPESHTEYLITLN